MIAIAPTSRIFAYTAATDMRKGFCGLPGLAKAHFAIDLLSGHLFVFLFLNRKRDYVKILAWDKNGLSIWSKRLERGTLDHLPHYRGKDIFARAGMLIPRNTQLGMLANTAALPRAVTVTRAESSSRQNRTIRLPLCKRWRFTGGFTMLRIG